ncbi:hypothetical protein Zm00014a_044420 [Zea mays]|uniref:Uncharacterized protein n=1 Tax=Zea mays TaxID=4577 RepID=A0A3L6FQ87_MAIZE|nr:hypothetical protein Zm00014a_044420 [Zea mays]
MQPELLRHFQDRDVVVTDHAVRKVKLDELAVALTDGVQACISDLAASLETEVGGGKGSVMGLNQGRNTTSVRFSQLFKSMSTSPLSELFISGRKPLSMTALRPLKLMFYS